MTSSVIFQKKKNDIEGYLFIQYSNRNIRKKVSLQYKMLPEHFDNFYDTEFKRFKRTHLIEYKVLNKKIEALINDFSLLEKDYKEASYIKFFQERTDEIIKESSKDTYKSTLRNLKDYLTTIDKQDLSFSEIDSDFVKKYTDYLILKPLSNSTIKLYFTIMKIVLKKAIEKDLIVYEKPPFRNAVKELKVPPKPKRFLTDADISKLIRIRKNKDEKSFYMSRMFLFSLFAQGMRFSDLITLRLSDIKQDIIEYTTLKNKKGFKIKIDVHLNRVICDILELPNYHSELKENCIVAILDNDKTYRTIKNEILNIIDNTKDDLSLIEYKGFKRVSIHNETLISLIDKLTIIRSQIDILANKRLNNDITKMNRNDLLFKKFIDSDLLNKYSKKLPYTSEQYREVKILIVEYNKSLRRICSKYDLSVDRLSSHNARHTFTNLILQMNNINLLDISKLLGHTNLSTTQSYISSGFEFNKHKDITEEFSRRFRNEN